MGKERARRAHWLEPVKIYYMKAALQNAPIITRLLDVLKSKNEKAMEIIALYFKNNDLKKTVQESQLFNQLTVMKAGIQHEPWTWKDENTNKTKKEVEMTLTSAQTSTAGENPKYLAPLFLSFWSCLSIHGIQCSI